MTKYIYTFGSGTAEGLSSQKHLLGGKGAGLAEMCRLGLPVPPGFTITTEVCRSFFSEDGDLPEGLQEELDAAILQLEERSGKQFASSESPLLVSVRSGAPVSMPGMMDTVLNLGLNDETVRALAQKSQNERFAFDAYRRFVKMFGDIVLNIHYSRFTRAEEAIKKGRKDPELTTEDFKEMVAAFKEIISADGFPFPTEPREQLRLAINAVFKSFNNTRARYHRKSQGIPDDTGTAVNIQAMVFGNMGEGCATGVCFTRDPKTGEKTFFGEWLPNAQGEDVVSGSHTPFPIVGTPDSLEHQMPTVYGELFKVQDLLEQHYKDMQDIEFTIENNTLYLLQTRTGKRSPAAALRIAVELVEEGVISKEKALLSVEATSLELLLRPVLDPTVPKTVICKGLDASPGAATGRVVFTSEQAQELSERGEPIILVRVETSPEDIQGMTVSEGIITSQGGQTSHAAVVARGMGKPCIVGCTEILVDEARKLFYAGDYVIKEMDWITIDGATGEVIQGKIATLPASSNDRYIQTFLSWADEIAELKVRANADNAADALRSREMGAVGIGLCRTEHMFFQPDALRAMRQMLLARDDISRKRALQQVLPIQREQFVELFRVMDGLPVTIRLLDPPLHEFLPKKPVDIAALAVELGLRDSALKSLLNTLHEVNPMLGHRGCRIGITSPEIYRTQVQAIFEAACIVTKEGGTVVPEVMIPLVSVAKELEMCRNDAQEIAEKVIARYSCPIDYRIGTMIEIPRACIRAKEIAAHADFFSFGTNDLTQLTYGFSRDDMGKFLANYLSDGVLKDNPLTEFDIEGVGPLVEMGTKRGRHSNARLKVGICGEHGGNPKGIAFFHKVGLDYVSCSPFRVPVARLAAAQVTLE
jgi:pyruvate,orthophosphate dikinase